MDGVGTLQVVEKSGNNLVNALVDVKGQRVVFEVFEAIEFAAEALRAWFSGNYLKNRDMYTVFLGYRWMSPTLLNHWKALVVILTVGLAASVRRVACSCS